MNALFSIVLFLFLFVMPAKADVRATYFDTGPQVITADGIALTLPDAPAGAIGYNVEAVLTYDFTMTVENRTKCDVDWVETGGNFLAVVGGTYVNTCYGALTPALSATDSIYWGGNDCVDMHYKDRAVMAQTWGCPISQWTGELSLFRQGTGVQGYMTQSGHFVPGSYDTPYLYGDVSVRLRGRIVWVFPPA